jgi:hypothetical protein
MVMRDLCVVANRKVSMIRRPVFTILALLSLWLCIATLVLWVQSYWRLDELSYCRTTSDGFRIWAASSIEGELDMGTAIKSSTNQSTDGSTAVPLRC